MITAILVTLAALVVLGIIAIVVFRVRSNTSQVRTRKKMGVKSIMSVGVSAQAPKVGSFGGKSSVITSSPSKVSQESMRSRFTALGVIVAGVFGVLTAKLFSMQVIESASYKQEAEENLYTTVATPAPRGVIYDCDGVALVTNRQVQTVLADADVADNYDVVLRLSALLGIPFDIVLTRIKDTSSGAQSQRVVASDVSLRSVAFIAEHKEAFPGVTTEIRTTRTYPYGALGSHVLGYVGTASEDDMKNVAEGRTVNSGDVVGKSGIEQAYDDLIAGDHGQRVLVTDASGAVKQVVSELEPTKGNDIYLTISSQVQYVADTALRDLVQGGVGTAASVVVMDVETGGILALANYPTYEPEQFIGGISQDIWDEYQTEESHYPLMNRAIAGTYPAASCFKAFSGMAGLTYGFATADKEWDCEGTWTGFGEKYPQKCWNHSGHGYLNLRGGYVNSCDVVFYEIAKDFYNARASIGDTALQDFIKQYGYSNLTGIDITGEAAGRIPTPEWKEEYFKDVPEEAQWLPGDMSNMVIGQGYVLVTPLQVSRSYAAIASGKLLTPHLLKEVRNSSGDKVLEKGAEEIHSPEVSEENLHIVQDGLYAVATENSDVYGDFGSLDFSVAAKTGTAEVAGKQDFAWFACYAPYENPRYALSICIEEGGSGGAVASPVAARIMDAAIKYDRGELSIDLQPIETGGEVANGSDVSD